MDADSVARFARQVAFTARTVEHTLDDLSLTAYRVLTLVAQGDARSSVIARLLAVGRPTVTYAVDSLVERGLVERVADEGDRRVAQLQLTQAGTTELAHADARLAERFQDVFDRVEDPAAVLEAFDRFYGALSDDRAERYGQPDAPPGR